MISRCIQIIFAAVALAGCCASGNGCYAPTPGVPIAWDGLGTAPSATDQGSDSRPRKTTRAKREIIVGPVVTTEPNSKPEGKEAWVRQEAADRADEERLAKKLMICRNCQPAPTHEDSTETR